MNSEPITSQDPQATRITDKRMPAEDLPYPLGKRHAGDPVDDNRLYGLLGNEALFEHIGLRPRINVPTRDEWRAFGGRLNGEMFAGLKKVFGSMTDIEAGRSGSPASMTSDAEFAAFGAGQSISPTDDPAHFFAFRSRDAEWIGFRWRDESFRFRRASLLGFALETAMPARCSGYFQLWAVCVLRDEQTSKAWLQNVEAESFIFDGQWTAEVAFELLSVMTNVANFFGTTLTARQFSDV